jgi:hypothetical protein
VKAFAGGDDARLRDTGERGHETQSRARRKTEPRPSEQEFWLGIFRKMSDVVDGWKRCDNRTCRRKKRCCGDAQACRDDGRPARTFTQEERAKAMHDLRIMLEKRRAEVAAGAPVMDLKTLRKLRDKERAKARRKSGSAQIDAAKPGMTPQAHGDEAPASLADEPRPSPEVEERVNRIWNDYVASLPAEDAKGEDAGKNEREPGPRITML